MNGERMSRAAYQVHLTVSTDRTSDSVVDLTAHLQHAVVSAGFSLEYIGMDPLTDSCWRRQSGAIHPPHDDCPGYGWEVARGE